MKTGKTIGFSSSNNHSNQPSQKLQAAATPRFKISNSKIRQKREFQITTNKQS